MKFKKIEKLKDLLIVVLFSLAILLSYFTWNDFSFMGGGGIEEAPIVEVAMDHSDLIELIKPEKYYINFGGGLYTVLYSDNQNLWNQFLEVYLKMNQENVNITQIDESEWIDANEVRSFRMAFAYDVRAELIDEVLDIKKNPLVDEVTYFKEFTYSTLKANSFFINDVKNQLYYRMDYTSENKELLSIIDRIEEKEYEVYYKIEDIYGVQNKRLMSVVMKNNIEKISVAQEIKSQEIEKIELLASTFFSEKFDFVRKIIENDGTTIYMYGYGQKIFKVDANGWMEYESELDLGRDESQVMLDALKQGINFIKEHGSWKSIDGINIYPYLKEIEPIEKDKKTGYRFIFGYNLEGIPVYYNQQILGNSIEIDIIGKQVIRYKRYILNKVDQIQYIFNEEDGQNTMKSSSEVFNDNYVIFKNVYEKNHENDINESLNLLESILNEIQPIKLGYFKEENEMVQSEFELTPVWIFEMENHILYFDVETGNMVFDDALTTDGESDGLG